MTDPREVTQGPATSPGYLLWHVTLAWQRAVTSALAPLGLTHVQFVLLASAWWLDASGERPSQQQLAAHGGVEVRMASQVVRSLEAKGLLARAVDERDTRVRRVTVTAAGRQLAPVAVRAVENVDDAFFAPVPKEDAVAVLAALAGRPSPRRA